MPPDEEMDSMSTDRNTGESQATDDDDDTQYLLVVRHGDRYDYKHPEWKETSTRKGDPPLSQLGHQQARETGVFLDSFLSKRGIYASNVTWLSSPFLRCLQTSTEALNMMSRVQEDDSQIQILPEYSVFEMDGHNGAMHASLPPLHERSHYFPRVNASHESLFVPPLPEAREGLLPRCDKAVQLLNQRYPYRAKTAIVVVTHAAACIGLVRAAAGRTLADVTPAAPCGLYLLTRTSAEATKWHIEDHDAPQAMNGYTTHLSDLGTSTKIWNHFGEKRVNIGYTGPPNSRFAPANYAVQPPPPKHAALPVEERNIEL